MPRRTQAEIFIETLAEILEDERNRRAVRLMRQTKLHAEKVNPWLPAGTSDDQQALWPLQSAKETNATAARSIR